MVQKQHGLMCVARANGNTGIIHAPVWWHAVACMHLVNKSNTDVSSTKAVYIIVPTYTARRRTRPLILFSGEVTTATSPVNSLNVPPNVIFAKAVCHMLWSMWVRLESKHSQPCKNRAQIGLFWACVYMNLPLVTELACCLFRCFFGGRSVAIYGDTSEYYSVIVIILIDRNIHCLLWTARGVAFVCRPELPLRPWKQQPLKSKTAKFFCALAGT